MRCERWVELVLQVIERYMIARLRLQLQLSPLSFSRRQTPRAKGEKEDLIPHHPHAFLPPVPCFDTRLVAARYVIHSLIYLESPPSFRKRRASDSKREGVGRSASALGSPE
jgi:hypothetical protein